MDDPTRQDAAGLTAGARPCTASFTQSTARASKRCVSSTAAPAGAMRSTARAVPALPSRTDRRVDVVQLRAPPARPSSSRARATAGTDGPGSVP